MWRDFVALDYSSTHSTNVLSSKLSSGEKALYKAKILIIDDEPAMLGTLHEYLDQEGYRVVEAVDLKSALQAVEKESPDITVTDYDLPDGDALQFLSVVYYSPDTDVIPPLNHELLTSYYSYQSPIFDRSGEILTPPPRNC